MVKWLLWLYDIVIFILPLLGLVLCFLILFALVCMCVWKALRFLRNKIRSFNITFSEQKIRRSFVVMLRCITFISISCTFIVALVGLCLALFSFLYNSYELVIAWLVCETLLGDMLTAVLMWSWMLLFKIILVHIIVLCRVYVSFIESAYVALTDAKGKKQRSKKTNI